MSGGVQGVASPWLGGVCGECHLLAEADHRIANHLALLAAYVRLKTADLEPGRDPVRLLLAGVGAQIGAVSRLHRAFAAGGRQTSVDLGEHLHEICTPFAAGLFGAVRLDEDLAPGCIVRPDQILPLVQIVDEVITNAVKHGGRNGEAGAILVGCRRVDTGAVLVDISDDGPGLPPTFDPDVDGGIGFRLLRALGRQLGAFMAFESSDDGLCFRLTLPARQSSAG